MQNAANFDRAETSKANGSLMRATPIGVWGHLLTDEELAEIARLDCSLSHPNVSVCAAVAAYSIAIAELVGKPSATARHAFDRAKAWVAKNAPEEVRTWMQEAENNVITPYYPHPGFVRIAFVHAFRHLLLGTPYEVAIAETVAGGGDSDTNACIVGGLVGAAKGAASIPEQMSKPVLTCDTAGTRLRPPIFRPADLADLAKDLLAAGAILPAGRIFQTESATADNELKR